MSYLSLLIVNRCGDADLSRPMVIDFFVAVPNEKKGIKVKEIVEKYGFEAKLSLDKEENEWTCYCTKEMLLEHTELLNTQAELNKLSKPFKGYSDGWGTFGNTQG